MKHKPFSKTFYNFVGLLVGISLLLVGIVISPYIGQFNNSNKVKNISGPRMSELVARTIAEQSCIKGGAALETGTYDKNTNTWSFDANLNSEREGCLSKCVVSASSKTAELVWKCDKSQGNGARCEVTNCHGLDVTCGSSPARVCTMMYQLGDKCLQFAKCGVVNGSCTQINNEEFNSCKSCVESCERNNVNDPEAASVCESNCGL